MATETLRPSAAGDLTELAYRVPAVANYLNMDESSADDATTTNSHNGADNSTAKDLYNITDSAIGAGTINSVTIYLRAQGNTAWYKTLIKTHATEYLGAQSSTASGFSTTSTTYTTNPNTGIAWTWTEINDLQIGVQEFRSPTEVGYVTQVYIDIDYTAGSSTNSNFFAFM